MAKLTITKVPSRPDTRTDAQKRLDACFYRVCDFLGCSPDLDYAAAASKAYRLEDRLEADGDPELARVFHAVGDYFHKRDLMGLL